MENKKKKLSDRPLLAGFVAMLLAILFAYIGGYVIVGVISLLMRITGIPANIDQDAKVAILVDISQVVIPIMAAIWMYIYYRRNQKNGYRGAMKIRGKNCLDVWVCIGIFFVVTIVRYIYGALLMPGGLSLIHIGMSAVISSIYAGVSEEIVTRGIPFAIMMRGEPDAKRIRKALVLTSIVFALFHLLNGGGAGMGIYSVALTFAMGLCYGAVYLRTGSILASIIFHFADDIFALTVVAPNPTPALYIVLFIFNLILPVFLTIALMRKSKVEEIKETWATIWGE